MEIPGYLNRQISDYEKKTDGEGKQLGINRYHKEGKHCMYMLDVLILYVGECMRMDSSVDSASRWREFHSKTSN